MPENFKWGRDDKFNDYDWEKPSSKNNEFDWGMNELSYKKHQKPSIDTQKKNSILSDIVEVNLLAISKLIDINTDKIESIKRENQRNYDSELSSYIESKILKLENESKKLKQAYEEINKNPTDEYSNRIKNRVFSELYKSIT